MENNCTVDTKEVILIHELGHLYFPKEVNDMRLDR